MSTAITTRAEADSWGYLGNDLESAGRLAKALVASGIAPTGLTAGAAFYIMLAGKELGLRGPVEALRHIQVVKGKPAMSAELMRAFMLEGGCKIEWLRQDDTGATLKVTRPDGTSGAFSFLEADAKRAGLLGVSGSGWSKYPAAMFAARATSIAARLFCPDLVRGATYLPEELGAKVTVTSEGDFEYHDAPDVTPHDDDPKPNGGKALPAPNGNGGEVASRLPEDPVASTAQVKALAILATKKLGGIPRGDRLRIYEAILQREVETSADVTVSEWRQLVDALNQMSDKAVAPGEGTPKSEAETAGVGEGVRGTAHEPAPDGNPHGLWDSGEETPSEPSWKKLNPEQSAVRNAIVKLAQSVEWINAEDKTVFATAAIREAFTVDPSPWVDPAAIATRPAPKRMLALYQQEVEAEQKRQKEGAAA